MAVVAEEIEYWTPSGPLVTCSAGTTFLIQASNQQEGLAKIVNAGTTTGLVFLGGSSNGVPVLGSGTLFIAITEEVSAVFVTGAANVIAQPGYAIK